METIQYAAKRNTLMVYLLADSSGSMEIDSRMKTANKIIDATIRKLQSVTEATDKAELVFCAYSYALTTKQIGIGPTPAKKFVWYEQTPENVTCMGAALSVLNNALNYCEGSIYQPIILILSDGDSIDDISSALNQLHQNPVFEKSCKFGISFDSQREEDLAAVVGNENIIHIQDIEEFYERIESAVQKMVKNQEIGFSESPGTQLDGVTGDSEKLPTGGSLSGDAEELGESNTSTGASAEAGELQFINHWSQSDWL